MTLREELHHLIDDVPDEELNGLARRLGLRRGNPTTDDEFWKAMDEIASYVDPDLSAIPLESMTREALYD